MRQKQQEHNSTKRKDYSYTQQQTSTSHKTASYTAAGCQTSKYIHALFIINPYLIHS